MDLGTGSCLLPDQFQQCLSCSSGRCRILASEKTFINDRKTLPIGGFLVDASQSLQLILDEERHDMGQMHFFLFAVGETGHALSLHDGLALVGHSMEDAGEWPGLFSSQVIWYDSAFFGLRALR